MTGYISCQHDGCGNHGAVYTVDPTEPAGVIHLCPVCGKAMDVVPSPLSGEEA